MKPILVAVLAFVLAGCVSTPQLTRDEWLAIATRTYPEKSKEDVFRASEQLFRLADGNDFQISYTENTMYAARPWLVYMVLAAATGTDTWLLTVEDTPEGARASIQVSQSSQAITAHPVVGGPGVATTTLPTLSGTPVQGTALYDLYWARMDYLLGRNPSWMTCAQAVAKVRSKATWGFLDPLCNAFNVDDKSPAG